MIGPFIWCKILELDYFLLSQCSRSKDGRTDRQMSTARPCVCIRSCTIKMIHLHVDDVRCMRIGTRWLYINRQRYA